LFLSGAQPARVSLAMRVELPGAMRAQVAVYDVAGRRMKTVLDRDLPAGQTAVSWDGRDASGARAASGVYFARLTCRAGNRVVKAVWLR
jgi:flagellar hook assembly protein FlgD